MWLLLCINYDHNPDREHWTCYILISIHRGDYLINSHFMKNPDIFQYWKNTQDVIIKLKKRTFPGKRGRLVTLLLSLYTCLPSDFSLKIRGVQDIMHWKSTEYRMFLLYSGPIVLKSVQNDECYHHFMVLIFQW